MEQPVKGPRWEDHGTFSPGGAAQHGVVDGIPVPHDGAAEREPVFVDGEPLYAADDGGRPKFVVQGYKDVWAAVLFLVAVALAIGVGSYNVWAHGADFRFGAHSATARVIWSALGVGVVSCFTSVGFIHACRACPAGVIIGGNVAASVSGIALGGFVISEGNLIGGVIMMLFAGAWLVLLYVYRAFIPFSAVLLRVVAAQSTRHWGTIVVSFVMLGAALAFGCVSAAIVYPAAKSVSDDESVSAGDVGLLVFGVFVMFWFAEVAFNVAHMTTAGVVATCYFMHERALPRNCTAASLRRAMTTSFGSVCFGSLVVAVLKTMRALVQSQTDHDNAFIGCIMVCVLRCLEMIMEYVNEYAFAYCAIYGFGYVEAAKRTLRLARRCAFAALFNNALIGRTLLAVTVGVSAAWAVVFSAAFGYAAGAVAALVSMLVHSQFFTVVDSGVTALFVCYAEDPDVLATTNPELHALLSATPAG